MKVFITGGTGLVGGRLIELLLERGDEIIVLSRDQQRAETKLAKRHGDAAGIQVVQGDPAEAGDWMKRLDGCHGVVNLAGEPVFGRRWNRRQKERLRNSRVDAAANIVAAIHQCDLQPKVLANASAIGYYGNLPEGKVTESSPAGDDFLADVCVEWETAAQQAAELGVRVALVRIGVVLSPEGGALKQMLLPFKLGLGGPVGRGKQWVSWIHLNDMARALVSVLDDPTLHGPINATAPQPVINKEFSQCLARALRRPCLFPVPPFMLRLVFGEVAYVVTTGQHVMPARLRESGFEFQFEDCQAAMNDLFGRS